MNKMTLKEKLEVIKAYAEGKTVEVYDEDSDEGLAKQHDIWDFEYSQYRIKPDETPKFKVGDKIVYKSDEGYATTEIYEVTKVTQEGYRLDDMIDRTPKYVEKDFINVRDVLWFFEMYDYATKKYYRHPTRMTMAEMDEEFGANHDTLSWKPMYSLGFKLKEN